MEHLPSKLGDARIDILVGALEHDFYFSIQLGMSSSQLTNSLHHFSEG